MVADATHRPWPRPSRPWVMAMRWHDLAFLHWPVKAEQLRAHVPPGLALDTFDGWAWLGVVPFRMSGVRPRLVPPTPWTSAFLELNVRTYVTAEGKPGVWFFSLDAGNPLAVWTARRTFHLPYFNAEMSLDRSGESILYASRRTHRAAAPARFEGTYAPTGAVMRAARGSIEHWLTERYCLYAADPKGTCWRAHIDHRPWPLRPAEADIAVNTMAEPIGITLPKSATHVHFAERLDVVAWWLEKVG